MDAVNQQLALQILGLSGNITKEQVKRAYRSLCKKLHPDDNSSQEAYEQYLQVQMAYQWMMEHYVFSVEQKTVHVYGNIYPTASTAGSRQTGKIIGGGNVSEQQYMAHQFRRMQSQKLEQERKEKQRQKQREEQERKKKIWEAMQNARKLPSQREAEKWKKIEAKREAERIAEIIKQLIMLDEINKK